MRLSRGTFVLIVVCVIVIIGVLLINNNPTSAPGNTTPTASQAAGGPLFPGIDANTLVRFEIRDNRTGERTVLTRTSEDVWGLDESDQPGAGDVTSDALSGVVVDATAEAGALDESAVNTFSVQTTSGQPLDQNVVLTDIGTFLGLNATDSFESEDLASFGLDHPGYSILASAEDGTVYELHIGGANPSGNRYYAVLEQLTGADESFTATEEDTSVAEPAESADDDLGTEDQNIEGAALTEVPSVDADTAVEVAESLTEAIELGDEIQATNAASGTQIAQATEEAGAETNANANGGDAGSDANAVATQEVSGGESSGRVEQISTGAELSEVTAEPGDVNAVAEATEAVLPVTGPTPTLAPLAEPLVALQPPQTILTLPKTALDTLIALITTVPYAAPAPTEAPTLQPDPSQTEEAAPVAEATSEPAS